MAGSRFQRASELFLAGRHLDLHTREEYLDKECENDLELRLEVERLFEGEHKPLRLEEIAEDLHGIHDHLRAQPKAERPVLPAPGESAQLAWELDLCGSVVGPYRLLEKIGEGAFGVVYMAEQREPIHRKVALKVIKLGMDTRHVLARFEAERQALAMMEHDNIAKVFDAGQTARGRPYFVMELVHGVPITTYCDDNRLSMSDRMRLFVDVCHAIQHAHQKGVIHRDIKPSNVLVESRDGRPIPKVIDFGIAKATGQPLTDKTLFTEFRQLIGTPAYMSPEQADQGGRDVDTRSDVYSLGVLLYELLTGTTPIELDELKNADCDTIKQLIREKDAPKPSTRLSRLALHRGAALHELEKHEDQVQSFTTTSLKFVASRRATDPARLMRQIRGDLDWIVMKCLDKDRARRYETVAALAEDVERSLRSAPVLAGPPDLSYRIYKALRRHRSRVIASAVCLVAILIGGLLAMIGLVNASREGRLANEALAEARDTLYALRIGVASAAYEGIEITRMRESLESCTQEMRGWEWYRLWFLMDDSLMTIDAHENGVYSVALSADTGRVFSGGKDRCVSAWDATTGANMWTRCDHARTVMSVAVSPDGRWVASGSEDHTVRIRRAADGEPVAPPLMHPHIVMSLAFSADGDRLVCGCIDGTLTTWKVPSGERIKTVLRHPNSVTDCMYSPDGRRIVSAGLHSIRISDADTGSEILTIPAERVPNSFSSLDVTADGAQIISGSEDGIVRIWQATTGRLVARMQGRFGAVTDVAQILTSDTIVSAHTDTSLRIWKGASAEPVRILSGHEAAAMSLSVAPDGARIVSGGMDGKIKFWYGDVFSEVLLFQGHWRGVSDVDISPDGTRVVSVGDWSVRVWDSQTGEELLALRPHLREVNVARFSPNDRWIATGSNDTTIKLLDSRTGAEVDTFRGHSDYVNALAFSSDSGILASGGNDSTVRLWTLTSRGRVPAMLTHASKVTCLAFTPSGRRLVTGSHAGIVRVWSLSTGEQEHRLEGHTAAVKSIAVSPDGTHAVSGGADGKIIVWSIETGEEMHVFAGHLGPVTALVFEPDQPTRVISASTDGTLTVWDIARGRELLTIRNFDGISSLTISPSGKNLIAGLDNGNIIALEATRSSHALLRKRKIVSRAHSLVEGLFEELISAERAVREIKEIRATGEVDHMIVDYALRLAERRGDDSWKLNIESWDVAIESGKSLSAYKLALEKATIACDLAGSDWRYLNTLGIAEYRVGNYGAALDSLVACDDVHPGEPANVAFIAMALEGLGRHLEAVEKLSELGALMEIPEHSRHAHYSRFIAEAKTTVGGSRNIP